MIKDTQTHKKSGTLMLTKRYSRDRKMLSSHNVTAGCNNSALILNSDRFSEILNSPLEQQKRSCAALQSSVSTQRNCTGVYLNSKQMHSEFSSAKVSLRRQPRIVTKR